MGIFKEAWQIILLVSEPFIKYSKKVETSINFAFYAWIASLDHGLDDETWTRLANEIRCED